MKGFVYLIGKNGRLYTKCGRMNSRLEPSMTLFKLLISSQCFVHFDNLTVIVIVQNVNTVIKYRILRVIQISGPCLNIWDTVV